MQLAEKYQPKVKYQQEIAQLLLLITVKKIKQSLHYQQEFNELLRQYFQDIRFGIKPAEDMRKAVSDYFGI